jgi:hypothetical protein
LLLFPCSLSLSLFLSFSRFLFLSFQSSIHPYFVPSLV